MSRIYPLGIVGESHYQPAIARCAPGEPVRICQEPDNPFDAQALRVESSSGEVIGYVPRSSWLRRAIHQEGRGCACTILSIDRATADGLLGVVINVTLTDDDVRLRAYRPIAASGRSPERPSAGAQRTA